MVCFRAASSNGVLCFVWSAFVPALLENVLASPPFFLDKIFLSAWHLIGMFTSGPIAR
ncbi:uncharacterized protein RHIMIDRAFT_16900 [Rhizopus microsporus ATCC 52813]|uniref:Uncharacterized protein n=1 Tax=Rhizopus microsporus ATCC 52813 TaxID=1340429 RepID=A0A2G4SS93_RHIZD|nr:uncharacterized protein RHIMIDRAFT_16900 [Rhizopus microsporus ATCC 52813]PHZ11634.1 hypothetical protein RHIMIDRAFT_16900 [Rhizopus microsporus ATCC 52813]